MNWVDLIIIASLALFAIESYGRPFLLEALDLFSFILALIFSLRFYNYPAQFFQNQFSLPHGFSLVLGFMAAWFLTEILFYFLVRVFLPRLPKIRIKDSKTLAIIPGIFRGLILISLILVVLATFPVQPTFKKSVKQSKIGSFLLSRAYQLESPVKQIFGGAAQDTLTFLTIKPKSNEKIDLGFQTIQYSIDTEAEEAMVKLVNQERVSRGLEALEFDEKLREVARLHSEDMFKRGYFSHFTPERESVADRAQKKGVDYLVIGENLAFAPSLELAHKGLMNSLGHRANILSADFHKIGIGVLDGGDFGRMFTQVFSN